MKSSVVKDKMFLTNIAKLFSSSFIAQLVPFIVLPFLTRLYSPDDFGVWAYFLSISGIYSILMTGNYEFAIVLPKEEKEAANVTAAALTIAVIMFIAGVLIIPFFGSLVLKSSGIISGSASAVLLIPATAFVMALFRIANYWNNRDNSFGRIAVGNISRSVSSSLIQLFNGIYSLLTYSGLVIGTLAGYLIGTAFQSAPIAHKLYSGRKSITLPDMKNALKRYKKFPKFFMPSEFLNFLSSNVPVIFLTNLFDVSVTGFYSVPHRFINTPMTMLGSSISQAYFKKSNDIVSSGGSLGSATSGIYEKLFMIGILPMSVIAGYGDHIFGFLLGEKWAVSGVYASFLAPWMLMVFVASPISIVFATLEKQEISLKINVFLLAVRVLAFVIGGIVYGNAMLAVFLFGATGFVFWLFYSFYVIKISGGDSGRTAKFVLAGLSAVMLPVIASRGVIEWLM
jgi:lipopolysaccharide exporter